MNTCLRCRKKYTYRRSRNSKVFCGSCIANRGRFKKKSLLIAYKGGKCENCNYDKNQAALSFHHLDPKEKDFEISGKHCLSLERLKKEVDKCSLLCLNCHAETHANQNL
jgi:aconitase B